MVFVKITKNKQLKSFLDDIKATSVSKFKILQKLRKIVLLEYPQAKERIIYGGIMFSLDEDFGGIFVYKDHLNFEFGNGYKMKDSKRLLAGKGKFCRHLKFFKYTDIEKTDFIFFLKQAL